MIGINDIWRQFDRPLATEDHVYIEEYRANLEWMVSNTVDKVKGLCLITPCYMEQNHQDSMRAMTDRYIDVMKKIADKYNVIFVDAQKSMDEYFKYYPAISMSADRVHPNHIGHILIAKSLVNTLGYEWN